jgi:hypothetical protein
MSLTTIPRDACLTHHLISRIWLVSCICRCTGSSYLLLNIFHKVEWASNYTGTTTCLIIMLQSCSTPPTELLHNRKQTKVTRGGTNGWYQTLHIVHATQAFLAYRPCHPGFSADLQAWQYLDDYINIYHLWTSISACVVPVVQLR